jgi:hypothetical protein
MSAKGATRGEATRRLGRRTRLSRCVRSQCRKCRLDRRGALLGLPLDVEVPEPEYGPALVGEARVHSRVARSVARDLLVPEGPGLAVVDIGVAVPEGSVHEDRKP